MKLIDVYSTDAAAPLLYELLQEREASQSISHEEMPTFEDHLSFVLRKPYAYWYLILRGGEYIGSVSLTKKNEIGIAIFKESRGYGFGEEAVKLFISKHNPLPAIPSQRSGKFIANINPENEASIHLFEKIGFKHIQSSYAI